MDDINLIKRDHGPTHNRVGPGEERTRPHVSVRSGGEGRTSRGKVISRSEGGGRGEGRGSGDKGGGEWVCRRGTNWSIDLVLSAPRNAITIS